MVPFNPLKCTVVFNVSCKKNPCVVETFWPMWNRSLTPLSYHRWGGLAAFHICRMLTAYLLSHQRGSYPFSYQLGHWRFSLLGALNKDGPGLCSGHLQAAQPRTCGPWKVYINIVPYLSSSNIVFWNAFPNDYLHSIDCCYIFRFD